MPSLRCTIHTSSLFSSNNLNHLFTNNLTNNTKNTHQWLEKGGRGA